MPQIFEYVLQTLLLFILLSSEVFIGSTIIALIDYKHNRLQNYYTLLGTILGINLFPLILYLLNYYFKLRITSTFIYLSGLLCISVCYFIWKKIGSPKYSYTKSWIIFFLLGFSLMFGLRARDTRMMGPDIYTYLDRSGYYLDTGYSNDYYDRNLVNLYPAILSLVSGVPIWMSLKLYVSVSFGLMTTALLEITKFLSKGRYYWLSAIVLINLANLRMSLDVIAMHWALVVLLSLVSTFILYQRTRISNLLLLIPLFLGIIFNTHILIAYFSLVYVGFFMLIHLTEILQQSFKKAMIISLISTTIFLVTAQPLFFISYRYLTGTFIMPFYRKKIVQSITPTKVTSKQTVSQSSLELKKNFVPSFSLRLKTDLLKDYYSSTVIIFGLFGILLASYSLRWNSASRKRLLHFYFLSLGFLAISVIENNTLSIVSARFILGLFIILIPWSVYSVDTLQKLIQGRYKLILLFLVCFFVIYRSTLVLPKLPQMFKATRNGQLEIFYQQIGEKIDSDTPVITLLSSPQFSAVNPLLNTIPVDVNKLCHLEELSKNNNLERLFSSKTQSASSSAQLKNLYGEYYVILNSSIDCINQELFSRQYYRPVASFKNYQLLQSR